MRFENGMSLHLLHSSLVYGPDTSCRNENFERILSTVVNNGLRAGWLSLGHNDGLGEMLPMLDPSNRPPTKTIDPSPVDYSSGEQGDSPLLPDPEPVKQSDAGDIV